MSITATGISKTFGHFVALDAKVRKELRRGCKRFWWECHGLEEDWRAEGPASHQPSPTGWGGVVEKS
jgi:hypothetical protein